MISWQHIVHKSIQCFYSKFRKKNTIISIIRCHWPMKVLLSNFTHEYIYTISQVKDSANDSNAVIVKLLKIGKAINQSNNNK